MDDIHSRTEGELNLELAVPGFGTGKCSCMCFHTVKDSDICVIDEKVNRVHLERFASQEDLTPDRSASNILERVRIKCHHDEVKFRLICALANVDEDESSISLKQLTDLHMICNRYLHSPLLEEEKSSS